MTSIKADVAELADKIKKGMKIDHKTGTATVEEDAYVKHLPLGLSKETVQEVQHYNTQFLSASALAFGHEAVPVMKKHQGVEKLTLNIPTVGKDAVNLVFERAVQVPARDEAGNMGGTRTKFGSMRGGYEMYGNKSVGDFIKVKKELADLAMAAFGS